MGLMKRLVHRVPPPVLRWLGSLQSSFPILRPVIRAAGSVVRTGEQVISHGVGRGLKFDPGGGIAGYALGLIDIPEQEALARYLRPGRVFYDIGANVGFFSTIAGRLTAPGGHVYAFEPFPSSAAAARGNASRNGFDHVTVVEAAVSGSGGTGTFLLEGGTAEFRLAGAGAAPATGHERIEVEVVAIDELLERGELRPPDVVMIDVEGAEVAVLEGMSRTIHRHRPVILCEVHWINNFGREVGEALHLEDYLVRQLDGSPLPTDPLRYHALLLPVEKETTHPSTARRS